jgi:hypothetical protein
MPQARVRTRVANRLLADADNGCCNLRQTRDVPDVRRYQAAVGAEQVRYLSVCSGIEAASVAWHPHMIRALIALLLLTATASAQTAKLQVSATVITGCSIPHARNAADMQCTVGVKPNVTVIEAAKLMPSRTASAPSINGTTVIEIYF